MIEERNYRYGWFNGVWGVAPRRAAVFPPDNIIEEGFSLYLGWEGKAYRLDV